MLSNAVITPGELQLPGVTRDPKDDAVIVCAHEGLATHIVTGDDDLLVLGSYEGIQIIPPQQFIHLPSA